MRTKNGIINQLVSDCPILKEGMPSNWHVSANIVKEYNKKSKYKDLEVEIEKDVAS